MEYRINGKTTKSLTKLIAALYIDCFYNLLKFIGFAGLILLGIGFLLTCFNIPYQYRWICIPVIMTIAAADVGINVYLTVRKAKRENKKGIIFHR